MQAPKRSRARRAVLDDSDEDQEAPAEHMTATAAAAPAPVAADGSSSDAVAGSAGSDGSDEAAPAVEKKQKTSKEPGTHHVRTGVLVFISATLGEVLQRILTSAWTLAYAAETTGGIAWCLA